MSEYANLLRSPLWQKKRLEILGIRGFKCEECGNTERELHVHHRWYEKGLKPWEYADHVYYVLCDKCHKERHEVDDKLRVLLGSWDTRTLKDIKELIGIPTPATRSTTLFFLAQRLICEVIESACCVKSVKRRSLSLTSDIRAEAELWLSRRDTTAQDAQGGSDA